MDIKEKLKEFLMDDDAPYLVEERNQCPVCNKEYRTSTNCIPIQKLTCANGHQWYRETHGNTRWQVLFKNMKTGQIEEQLPTYIDEKVRITRKADRFTY
jgi:hypothetical protein